MLLLCFLSICSVRLQAHALCSLLLFYLRFRSLLLYYLSPQPLICLPGILSKAEQRAIDAECTIVSLQARVFSAEEDAKALRVAATKLESDRSTMVDETSMALASAVEARTKAEAELAAAKASFAKKVRTSCKHLALPSETSYE